MSAHPAPRSPEFSPWIARLRQQRAIAVIRVAHWSQGVAIAEAVARGGMELIEITWNSDQPTRLVATLRERLPHCAIGAGTVLNPAQLQEAIAAGSQFVFTPHCDPPLITNCQNQGIPMVPGALTPTEIVQAWQTGAAAVKIFPIHTLGGAAYLKALNGPLGQIPLIPTGGITAEDAIALLQAGAIAVGLAGAIFPPDWVQAQAWDKITRRTRTLRQGWHELSSPPKKT